MNQGVKDACFKVVGILNIVKRQITLSIKVNQQDLVAFHG